MMEEEPSGSAPSTASDPLKSLKQDMDSMISMALAHIAFTVDVMKHLTTVATAVTVLLGVFHDHPEAAEFARGEWRLTQQNTDLARHKGRYVVAAAAGHTVTSCSKRSE